MSPTIKATDFLIVDNSGFGTSGAGVDAFHQRILGDVAALRSKYGLRVGYVDLSRFYNAVTGSTPGYKAFGYTSPGACLKSSSSTTGACADPAHTFMWIPG